MNKEELKSKIVLTSEEQKKVLIESESLSEAAYQILGTKSTLGRTIVKELCETYNLPLPQKKKNVKYCLECGAEITKTGNKFCSHSCAAAYNNKLLNKKTKKCKNCGNFIEKRKTYCDINCFREYRNKQLYDKWRNGELSSEYLSSFIRDFIFKKHNNKCEKCGWGEVNPHTGKIPLQVHHIDGDCTNNSEENLQLLCPNCHSLTETFGSLNKGNSKRNKRNEKRNI